MSIQILCVKVRMGDRGHFERGVGRCAKKLTMPQPKTKSLLMGTNILADRANVVEEYTSVRL